MSNVIAGPDGRMYYGARASWGLAETQADGLLHAVPLVPKDAPKWVSSASFSELISTDEGVYFVSPNGIPPRKKTSFTNIRESPGLFASATESI